MPLALPLCRIQTTRETMNKFNESDPILNDLSPKVKEKALQLAADLLAAGRFSNPSEALKEGVKQAEEWFLDLEG